VFRRRRRDGAGAQDEAGFGQAGQDDEGLLDDAELADDEADDSGPARSRSGGGPWDVADAPEGERIDFGSLLVPARDGLDVQINVADEQNVWITVVSGDSALQLQAFAAPKTSGLWREIRQEFAEEVTSAGGTSTEGDGPFGPELLATVHASGPDGGPPQPQLLRFLGVDGPRWFLRGMLTGPAAQQPDEAAELEDVFADVVVVRGDAPHPPREMLEIQLPEEARRALEEQMAAEGAEGQAEFPNPFERGPEITEIR
jgi:hypothetical protein